MPPGGYVPYAERLKQNEDTGRAELLRSERKSLQEAIYEKAEEIYNSKGDDEKTVLRTEALKHIPHILHNSEIAIHSWIIQLIVDDLRKDTHVSMDIEPIQKTSQGKG